MRWLCCSLYSIIYAQRLYWACTKYGHRKLDGKIKHTQRTLVEETAFPSLDFFFCCKWQKWSERVILLESVWLPSDQTLCVFGYLRAQPLCRGPATDRIWRLRMLMLLTGTGEGANRNTPLSLRFMCYRQGRIMDFFFICWFSKCLEGPSQLPPSVSCSIWSLVLAPSVSVDVASVSFLFELDHLHTLDMVLFWRLVLSQDKTIRQDCLIRQDNTDNQRWDKLSLVWCCL